MNNGIFLGISQTKCFDFWSWADQETPSFLTKGKERGWLGREEGVRVTLWSGLPWEMVQPDGARPGLTGSLESREVLIAPLPHPCVPGEHLSHQSLLQTQQPVALSPWLPNSLWGPLLLTYKAHGFCYLHSVNQACSPSRFPLFLSKGPESKQMVSAASKQDTVYI